MTLQRIQVLEHSPSQQAVNGIVESLPTHIDGLRVILESDQKIYTSHQESWIVDTPQEGWRCYLNFPGIEVIYKDGEWVEDNPILDSIELPGALFDPNIYPELIGPQGSQGNTGSQGTPGEVGSQGDQGYQGYQGAQGAQGDNGAQGNQGADGVQGEQGYQGAQGFQGEQGETGILGSINNLPIKEQFTDFDPFLIEDAADAFDKKKTFIKSLEIPEQELLDTELPSTEFDPLQYPELVGPQGYQGEQGEQGSQGTQGTQGEIGDQGNQGSQGTQGNQGFQGNQGLRGYQGYQGDRGQQGEQGAQGSQGLRGYQGYQGREGDDGAQGADGNQGATGSQGAQGHQGFQGLRGYQGYQGTQGDVGSQGSRGYQGEKGDKGDQGIQGEVGPHGPAGADGDDGREIELRISLTHIQWRYTGGTWINLIALSALKGDQGAPGADGDDGREIEIAIVEDPFAGGDYIKWRYVGTSSWTTLISVAAITGPAGAPGADGADGAPGEDGADGTSTYYTTHTLALSGIVPENTYFPGFTIDRILVLGSYVENQRIIRVAGRTLSGAVGIKVYRKLHGQTTGAQILPSTGVYTIQNTGNTFDVNYSLSHNDYIYFFIPMAYVNLAEDLSVTITIEHTPVSGGGGLETT